MGIEPGPPRTLPDGRTAWNFTFPVGSPLFAGHFPGRPILPGIAHLGFLEAAVAAAGDDRCIRSLTSVRWRKPAGPGDELELRISPLTEVGEGPLRFEVARGVEILSQGSVGFQAPASSSPDESLDVIVEDAFPPPGTLIPHGPPALLIERVLRVAPAGEIVCQGAIPFDHPLVTGGEVSSWLSLEAGAQAAALLEALDRGEAGGTPRIGYLVGIRTASLLVPKLSAGKPFRLTARLAGEAPPLSIYEIACHLGGSQVARGTLSTYLTDEDVGL